MSVIPAAKRSIRILALPLASAAKTPEASSPGLLTYYHFLTPPPPEDKGRNWTKWAAQKATSLWAGFGKAKDGSWQVWKCRYIHHGVRSWRVAYRLHKRVCI